MQLPFWCGFMSIKVYHGQKKIITSAFHLHANHLMLFKSSQYNWSSKSLWTKLGPAPCIPTFTAAQHFKKQ